MSDKKAYVNWLPALKLFYQFLVEKEYLAEAGQIIGYLDRIEPRFMDILRKLYG